MLYSRESRFIIGSSVVYYRKWRSISGADQARYYSIIYRRLADMNEMLEELFLYMKIENDHYQIKLEMLGWNEFIKQHLLSHYASLSENDLQPEVDLPAEPEMIKGNEGLLLRIHDNLLKNVQDNGGRDIYMDLRVRDEDGGVARFALRKRVGAVPAQPSKSSGLGLTIVKVAVENMQGRIEIHPDDETFEVAIELPVN